ncbi:MAG: hypothetical protein IRY99_11875, partial [Isosphaeraceae bacterium]|nr:hypothetical protein [Isosphaeraceae bacterium]
MSDDSLEIPTDTGRSTPEPTSMGEGLPLYVVAPRSGRLFSRLLPAFLVVVIAGAVLAYRLVTPDWRGLSAWSWPRRARPSPSAALQPPLALAGSPKRQKVQAGPTESQPTPAEAEKSKS